MIFYICKLFYVKLETRPSKSFRHLIEYAAAASLGALVAYISKTLAWIIRHTQLFSDCN